MIPAKNYTFGRLSQEEAMLAREALKSVAIASYGTHVSSLAPENSKEMMNSISKEETWELLLATSVCFVCKAGNTIVGTAYLVPHGNPWRFFKPEWSYIRMLGVHPDHGKKGIGQQLLSMCIGHARKTGEKTVTLHTGEFMIAARKMYEQAGFRILEELPPLLGKRYWLYILDLDKS